MIEETNDDKQEFEDDFESELKQEKEEKKKKVLFVDLMRIENGSNLSSFTSFEFKVRRALASAQTPADELIAREEERQRIRQSHYAKRKLACLARLARLPESLCTFYEDFYVKGLNAREIARIHGYSEGSMRKMHFDLKNALSEVAERHSIWKQVRHLLRDEDDPRLRTIAGMYFQQIASMGEIAAAVKLTERRIEQILEKFKKSSR